MMKEKNKKMCSCYHMFISYDNIRQNIFANDKKSNDMKNTLLSFYIKDVSNVESIQYIPLDKKIGNKRIMDKSNVVDIGFGEYYIKAKDEKKELQEPIYSSWYESPKGGMQFREKVINRISSK